MAKRRGFQFQDIHRFLSALFGACQARLLVGQRDPWVMASASLAIKRLLSRIVQINGQRRMN